MYKATTNTLATAYNMSPPHTTHTHKAKYKGDKKEPFRVDENLHRVLGIVKR